MNKEIKTKINGLARLFYKSLGYEVELGYDFSNAHHPQEIGMWNQALTAHCYYTGDFALIKHQK